MTALPRRPRAVLFDVGDTLLEERRFDVEAGIAAVVADRALAATLAHEFREALAERHREHRELPLAPWLRSRVAMLTSTPVSAIEDALWAPIVTLRPAPGVKSMLRRLTGDGVATAAISNAAFSSRILALELARHGLGPHLRFVLSSGDFAIRKPRPEIFHAALERLGVAAEHAWFVGNSLAEDVAGARAAGLEAVLFGATDAGDAASDHRGVRDWRQFVELYGQVQGGV